MTTLPRCPLQTRVHNVRVETKYCKPRHLSAFPHPRCSGTDYPYQPLGFQSATAIILPVRRCVAAVSVLGPGAAGVSTVAVAKQQHATAMSTHPHFCSFAAIGKTYTNILSLCMNTPNMTHAGERYTTPMLVSSKPLITCYEMYVGDIPTLNYLDW